MCVLQREVVEADGAQREGSCEQTHVCEENSDGRLEVRQLLQDGRRLDELSVGQRLLHLEHRSLELTSHKHNDYPTGFPCTVFPCTPFPRTAYPCTAF